LELKVVADIGLVGLPNVGKSSLLKTLTRANPKIAGYPFTTLEPNLGVMNLNNKHKVLVDVPGVVEQAWEGKGIGPWFLRHLERCEKLLHIVEAGDMEVMVKSYETVRKELEKYGNGLSEKPEIVVVNKRELIEQKDWEKVRRSLSEKTGREAVLVSAAMGEVEELVNKLFG